MKNEKPPEKEAKVTAYPEPKPGPVLYTDKEIIIDGKLDEWKEIKSMPMPFMKTDKGPLKLLWNKKGLYGAVKFKDDSIKESKESPWEGDAMELWLDTENTRAKSSDDVKHAFQIFILPDTEAGPGKCFIKINYNENEKDPIAKRVDASWHKTKTGYNIEFLIPASVILPAKMKENAKITFDIALDNDGKKIYQYYNDADVDSGWNSPVTWGALILIK